MKEKNKGFTLIELLAVIVILAIIALIATPIVINLLNKSRQKSAENSAYSYIKAIEYYIGLSELEMNPKRLEAGKCYNVNDSTIINEEATEKLNNLVDIKGSRPTGLEDRLCFDEKYTVKEGILTINGYTIEIKDGKVENSIKGAKINVLDFTLNVDSETTMERGKTFTIKANSFDPSNASNQKLLFKSKNEDIITVTNDGVVTALKNGEGTIVVTSEDNNNIKKEIKITVVSPQDIKEIEISKVNETEELYVGKYLELKATIKPSDAQIKTLTWSSSNDDIATVDEIGKVFGNKIGTAIITAESLKGVVAEFEVEVKEKFAESITISGTDEIVLGETTTLTATVNPDYTTDKTVTWTSSDSNIATVDQNGKVTGIGSGTVTITATTSNGKQATKQIQVKQIYQVYNDGDPVYYNPTAGEKCSAGETGCMKFYAFNDIKTSSTVNLILDHNTTPSVTWNSTKSNAEMKEVKVALEADTKDWIVAKQYDGLNARLISADEVAEITGAKEALNWDSKTSTSAKFYLDGAKGTDAKWQTQVVTSQGASEYAWLFDNTNGCTSYGCDVEDNNIYQNATSGSRDYIYGYWTSTPRAGSTNLAWRVYRDGNLDISVVQHTFYGVRPVITVFKSDI